MLEKMTQTLERMFEHAQREARELNQEFVGVEHLVLGILHCGEGCEAGRALRAVNINLEELRAALLGNLPRGDEAPVITGELPFSPKARRALNNAIVKAQSLREPHVSTRLVLLSLLDEPETATHEALRRCGGDIDQILRKLAEQPTQPEP